MDNKTVGALTWTIRSLWGTSGLAAAAANGVDLNGIAALVTSLTGLVAAVGAVFLAAKKRSSDATEKALDLLLRLEKERMEQQETEYTEMLRLAKARKQHKRLHPPEESDD